jgi:hypothetical protein
VTLFLLVLALAPILCSVCWIKRSAHFRILRKTVKNGTASITATDAGAQFLRVIPTSSSVT